MPGITAANRVATTKPTTSSRSTTAADLKTASGLKMVFPKFYTKNLPQVSGDKAPKNTNGVWTAPNGNKMFAVSLGSVRPGALDVPMRQALVDPKTNTFYFFNSGGLAPLTHMYGPAKLPAGSQFKGKTFSATELKALTKAANQEARTPTAKEANNALGAYNFQKLIKWGDTAPALGDMMKTIKLSNNTYPDAINTSAIVLRSDPTKIVFVQSGGIAGMTKYSQPVDWTRLPK